MSSLASERLCPVQMTEAGILATMATPLEPPAPPFLSKPCGHSTLEPDGPGTCSPGRRRCRSP
eukprot:4414598-Alexandrium_andersonii.AAC.1